MHEGEESSDDGLELDGLESRLQPVGAETAWIAWPKGMNACMHTRCPGRAEASSVPAMRGGRQPLQPTKNPGLPRQTRVD